jgi:hypothetical protein
MVRSFDGSRIDVEWLVGACEEALRAPTAGNCAGVSMTVIDDGLVRAYLDTATDEAWRARSPRAAGLMRAGAVVVVTSLPEAYARRYRESDKSPSELADIANWPVPYWHTDAAMATMSLLLLIEEAGCQAAMWGAFRSEREILTFARTEAGSRLFCSVLVGRGDGQDRRSRSLDRPVAPRRDRVRRLVV